MSISLIVSPFSAFDNSLLIKDFNRGATPPVHGMFSKNYANTRRVCSHFLDFIKKR